MSEIETCRNGHSRVDLFHTTPKGVRYCRECHATRVGAWRVKVGRISSKSKYEGAYKDSVDATIARLEADIHRLKKKIDNHKLRIDGIAE